MTPQQETHNPEFKNQKQEQAFQRQIKRRSRSTAKDTSGFYCTNKSLLAELHKWRDSAEDVEDRVISEELGKMILHIAVKLTNHTNFRNYPADIKQEMVSYACFKCVQGIKNYNFKFTNCFAYLTQACWNAFINIIKKYYKHINIKRDIIKDNIFQIESYNNLKQSKILNTTLKKYLDLDDSEDF